MAITTVENLKLDQSEITKILDIALTTDSAKVLRGALVQQILLLEGEDLINEAADIHHDLERFVGMVDGKDKRDHAYCTDAVVDFIDEISATGGVYVLEAIADVRMLEAAFMELLMTFPEDF